MIRTMLSSFAVAAMMSMATPSAPAESVPLNFGKIEWEAKKQARKPAPAASRGLKSHRRAVPCDCTNCSAPHCEMKGKATNNLKQIPLPANH